MSQSARLKKVGAQEIGARLGTLSKANRETVEVTLNLVEMTKGHYKVMFYFVQWVTSI